MRKPDKNDVLLFGAMAIFSLMVAGSFLTLTALEKSGNLFVSKRSYAPYLYANDYVLFYALANLSGSEDHKQIYVPELQDKFVNEVIKPLRTTQIFYSHNVPWLFLVLIPLSHLSLIASFQLFCALGMVFACAGLALVCRQVRSFSWSQTIVVVLAVVASLPAWLTLARGNTTYYLLGAACLYAWGFFKNHDVLSGAGLALLSQKPQYAIVMAIPALRYRRFGLLLAALVTELVLWGAAAMHFGLDNVLQWPSLLLTADTNKNLVGMYPLQMVSLRGIFAACISEQSSMPLAGIGFVIGCLSLLWLWSTIKADDVYRQRWAMALTGLTMLIISPHTCLYDVLLLSLPAVLTIQMPQSSTLKGAPSATVWMLLMALYPVVSWILYFTQCSGNFQHGAFAYLNLILLAVITTAYMQQKAVSD